MSVPAALLFRWLQRAPFYETAHRDAVELLPAGAGRQWLDVGCGPGLVTRLAARHGYDATGIDQDLAMINAARRYRVNRTCRFVHGDLTIVAADEPADVVSAASLLCTLPDPAAGLDLLWRAVRPGGALLIIETTAHMKRDQLRRSTTRPHPALVLWATVRNGRAIDRALYDHVNPASRHTATLLDGMLDATVITKPDQP